MKRFAAALLLTLAHAGTLHAQQGRATITGTVTDPSGAAVPAAQIIVRHTSTGGGVYNIDHRFGSPYHSFITRR